MKPGPLRDRSFLFALNSVKIYKNIIANHKEYVLARQFLRSSTSVGANIREAQNAQSRADFIHKLSIAQKECDESLYWLDLLHQSHFLPDSDYKTLTNEANNILKMIKSSILTAKGNRGG
ncbi:MAG: four helix bundle protein [Spirosomataceae bacterium]